MYWFLCDLDVSLRDSQRGYSDVNYGQNSTSGRRGVPPVQGQSGRVHIHDSSNYATSAPLHARGQGAPPGGGGLSSSRHGYDSGEGRAPPMKRGTGANLLSCVYLKIDFWC